MAFFNSFSGRIVQTAVILLIVLWGGSVYAGMSSIWQNDSGALKTGPLFDGAQVVEDVLAKGGKAICLQYKKEGSLPPVIEAKGIQLAGRGTIRVWVRGKDLNDVANGLRLTATLINDRTHKQYLGDGVVYAVRATESAYRPLPIFFEVDSEPAAYTLTLRPAWQIQKEGRAPTVWIGQAELLAHNTQAPFISGIRRSKLFYAPGMEIQVEVSVVNPTSQAFQGQIAVDELRGLSGRRNATQTSLALKPGEFKRIELKWKAETPEAGREMEIVLKGSDLRTLDNDTVLFGIAKDARLLAFPAKDFEQSWRPNYGVYSYVYPASYSRSRRAAEMRLANRFDYDGRCEFFSWAWCDLAGFVPPEDPFLGNAAPFWLGLKGFKEQIALLKGIGVHMESYILGRAVGDAAYQLFQQHPDWFMYDRNGELMETYNMEVQALYSRRHEFDDNLSKKGNSMWITFDPTQPEVRRFIADQIITLGKDMGFQGARWDVWSMNVEPGWRRLDGTEIAPTWPEADRLSAESLRAVKDMVAMVLPEFTWGYNYCSAEENKNTPLLFEEKCRGQGWLLDELAITYGAKTSPFHTWPAYSKRFVEWGDHCRRLNGIYDPWPIDRGYLDVATHYEVDWLHSTIFRILAGGRAYIFLYKNNSALYGDFPGAAFRYNEIYSGWNLRLQDEKQTLIRVNAPDTLWWKGYVFTNKTHDGKEQAIVHLVNSPVAEGFYDNPESKVRPPASNIKVTCGPMNKRLPQKAWLVMAEAMTADTEPKIQAVPLTLKPATDKVEVMVPAVLFLKTVVFEF